MRILSVHNRYQIRGGEDESRQSEENLLRHHGHEVRSYEANNDIIKTMSSANVATRTVWSQETYQEVGQILEADTYDIVHVQNFFPLISPSVFYAAKAANVPVVQTLRNYRLLCPNALFFRDGGVCEDCLGKPIPYPGIVHSCYRDNMAASAVTAAMIVIHRFLKTWQNKIDAYIALTQFAQSKFVENGFSAAKIHVKPNFVSVDPGVGDGSGRYALYVGRLSIEKGLDTLLAAWERLNYKVPLKIVGDGPLSPQVEAAAQKSDQVEWLGRRPIQEVYDLMGQAQFLVFPSKWYETFGRVAVEAFAKGTPVIASKIGAIAEIVDAGRTGLLFEAGNHSDLAAKVDELINDEHRLAQMRSQARDEFVSKYTAEKNYEALVDIYSKQLAS
ncbi:glycosyltransferase [Oscillatoria sp. CS-180]|uniref:glycosyltransferase n=1 Tax=Oscillatoria sp. CS-180 TaxID=3021720 RepID=UPI00232F5E29|nr:glycosyltransferase [Oscillatoria sp. CS-180]MDB9527386.1 glycosyltransferase [Oscillatoria sp. CS-180]